MQKSYTLVAAAAGFALAYLGVGPALGQVHYVNQEVAQVLVGVLGALLALILLSHSKE
jgi:hypothetical protein